MIGIWSKISNWVEDRLPVSAVLRWSLAEEIPGGSRFFYSLGSVNLAMFLLLAVTGVMQLFFYVPTTDHAYESVMFLRLQVPFGWLIHGLHYWAAQAFVISVSLHVARVFLWGAYKNPRQMTWIMGVFLLMLVGAMTFTGPLLAWDQLGYWAAEVGTSIAGTVPWIGSFLRRLVRGGDTMGQTTLSRFFIVHVAIVPGLLFFFIVVHLVAFRQFGSVGPWRTEKIGRTGKFWPEQVFKDTLVIALIILALIGLSAFWRAPITGLADPLGKFYTPKPAWNFLFLYQGLKMFKGRWEPVGTVGIPLLLILIFLLLPFYDRNPRRNPIQRPVAVLIGGTLVILIVLLTILGYLSHPGSGTAQAQGGNDPSSVKSQNASSGQQHGSSPVASARPNSASEPNGAAAVSSQASASVNIEKGRQNFQANGCVACHRINGQGGTIGPDLSNEGDEGRSAEWLATQIRDPKTHDPSTIMPSFSSLDQKEIRSLVDYLLSLHASKEKLPEESPAPQSEKKTEPQEREAGAGGETAQDNIPASGKQGPPGQAATLIGNADLGRLLFENYCRSCHGTEGKDNVPNPGSADGKVPPLNPIDPNLSNKDPAVFAANIDRFIQHGSMPEGPHPAIHMPPFGSKESLTQAQIANVEAYILHLNGVDRTRILQPGIRPLYFFFWSLLAIGGTFIVVLIFWRSPKRKENLKQ
jgi:ubiquinol-cytochrome c reductase cytochrome b subunit